MAFIARQKKVGLTSSSVTAHVSVLPKGNEGFQFGVQLEINLGGITKEQARELADAAHQMCPFSRATRGNIDVAIRVV